MKIIFTGDVFLGGDLNGVIGDNIIKSPSLENADKIIINLESPLSDIDFNADKGILYANPNSVQNLKLWNITAVNLANNHVQDKGNDGIKETLRILDINTIGYFGAGLNIYEASQPFFITDNLCVLGFCQFNAPTLNIIQIADNSNPGVNPLIIDHIFDSLDKLPEQTKAILHFHWGQEHLWFTQPEILSISKRLLCHPKVEMIIGMHPHRIQGEVKINNKQAYLCLGNFLFPNFYFESPAKLCYPKTIPEKIDVTFQYHRVSKLTYKKWRWKNRVSYLVEYDTELRSSRIIPMIQSKNKVEVKELTGLSKNIVLILFQILSYGNMLPENVYQILFRVNRFITMKLWDLYNKLFFLKQEGLIKTILRARKKFNL